MGAFLPVKTVSDLVNRWYFLWINKFSQKEKAAATGNCFLFPVQLCHTRPGLGAAIPSLFMIVSAHTGEKL